MARPRRRTGGFPPAALAALTAVGLTVGAVALLGSRKHETESERAPVTPRRVDRAPVDPFASLPREEWDAEHRQNRLVSAAASGADAQASADDPEAGLVPEFTGEGWTGALEAGRLADEQLERAKAMRGEVDLDTYKAAAHRAQELYEQALRLGAPILEAMGDAAEGSTVERRMSLWTSSLIALKKTTGL